VDIIELHRRSVNSFDERVHSVTDWNAPSACSDWSVKDLVNHIVYENKWTPDLLAGKTLEEVGDRYEGDLVGKDPLAAWHDSAGAAVGAVQGVTDLDQPVNVSWGQIPAREYIGQLFLDHLIHGWDLAKGTGGDTELDPELVEACWEIAKSQEDLIRGSGVFGDQQQVPDDAPTQTKLLALLGREG
jgi:uncharacterized protein (TIGR03086 family)